MLVGQKHLVQCRCILTQFRGDDAAPLHSFVVFSVMDDETGEVVPKTVQCNNCGVLHLVTDFCTSKVLQGKESSRAVMSIDDVRVGLRPNIVSVLEAHSADLPTWEQAAFIVQQKSWGSALTLTCERDDDTTHGKLMVVLGDDLCRVETFTRKEVV